MILSTFSSQEPNLIDHQQDFDDGFIYDLEL